MAIDTGIMERIGGIVLEKSNGNISMFCREIGFSPVTMNDYKSGKSKTMNSELLTKILTRYPDISAEWLLRGTGDMARSDGANTINVEANNNHGNVDTSINNHSGDQSALIEELQKEIEFYRQLLLNTTANANATFSKG